MFILSSVSYNIKCMFHKLLRRNIPAGEFQLPASELDHPESYQEHVSKESGKTPKDSKAADIERLTVKVAQIACPLLWFWILFVAIEFVTAVDLSILHGMYIYLQKSWDIALAPVKQIPMNLFIMWMSGNTISIFPIMMVAMMFFRPIPALFNYSQSKFFSFVRAHHIVTDLCSRETCVCARLTSNYIFRN